jgi:hypothetical protein
VIKLSKLFVCLGTVAMAIVSAATHYTLDLSNPATVAGTELKPGQYRLEIVGEKAMIQAPGKPAVEAPVKMVEGDQKYSATTVRYSMVDGKYRIDEIHLAGTKTRVVFNN